MFNKKNLALSFLIPVLVVAGLFLNDRLLGTEFLWIPLLLVYLEHILFGYLFGFDLGRDAGGGGFISFPLNLPVLTATVVLDYLLVAMIIYLALTYWRKSPNLK